jgi:predicted enzyme involved in methoxymalonyl-ACP biosynthesis
MKSSSSSVVMISLSDYLSDSGQIALVIGEMIDFKLVITELCISCRAMGRGLESSIILYAIKNMGLYRMGMTIYFDYKIEARNSPAIDWLKGLGAKINENNNSQFVLDSKTVDMFDVPKELKVSLNGKK